MNRKQNSAMSDIFPDIKLNTPRSTSSTHHPLPTTYHPPPTTNHPKPTKKNYFYLSSAMRYLSLNTLNQPTISTHYRPPITHHQSPPSTTNKLPYEPLLPTIHHEIFPINTLHPPTILTHHQLSTASTKNTEPIIH